MFLFVFMIASQTKTSPLLQHTGKVPVLFMTADIVCHLLMNLLTIPQNGISVAEFSMDLDWSELL